jgi:high-affinity Fe2+/Pb2+ permease
MAIPSSFRANRAIGAMFFSVFGGIFFAVWYFRDNIESTLVLALIILLTLCMVLFAIVTYNKNKTAFNDEKETPEKKKADKLFHIINAGQWILILIVGNLLANFGLPNLVIPAAIVIIGAHFLPLAVIFKYYPHYITGLLIITWAVVYPLLTGASNQGVFIGPGIILWLSALLGMTIKPFETGIL